MLVLISAGAGCSDAPGAGVGEGGKKDTASAPDAADDVATIDSAAPECVTSADCVGKVTITEKCRVPVCLSGEQRCSVTFTPDQTACDDDNACTKSSACLAGQCIANPPAAQSCDDADPCTDDVCDPKKGCQHPHNTAACDDGQNCTLLDACKDGTCAGEALVCTDNNPCTDDLCLEPGGCSYPDATGTCDDGDICTGAGVCAAGKCAKGKALPCDDGNPCTDDGCDSGSVSAAKACTHVFNTNACDDNSACTNDDSCGDGSCSGSSLTCDDGNPCTNDDCKADSGCAHAPSKAPCDDGDPCTTGDGCGEKAGKSACVGGSPLGCDDGNPCTDDSCNPASKDGTSACVHLPNQASCTDGNPCTAGDVCKAGACASGVNNCACKTDKDCAAAEDGDLCNGTLKCAILDAASSKCVVDANTVVVCAAAKQACKVVACDAKSGLCKLLDAKDGAACDDGSKCTTKNACKTGACGGAKANCDDGKPCSHDSCDKAKGCLHEPLQGAACDDNDPCTAPDACKDSFCHPGAALKCNDKLPCTADSCDKKTGKCAAAALKDGTGCDDGDACTEAETCSGGKCGGKAKVCNDGNVCTLDTCLPIGGCHFTIAAVPCDDGDACTTGDVCLGKACNGGPAKNCDDGDVCTVDSCSKGKCAHAPSKAACDDGLACTSKDTCASGKCIGTPNDAVCADASTCTDDKCVVGVGCTHTPTGTCSGCKGVQCLSCAKVQNCAKKNVLPGTCCELGDGLVYLGKGNGDEVVDVEVIGKHAFMCGGFGVRYSRITDPSNAVTYGGFAGPQRCQRVTEGKHLKNGSHVLYITHHGDDWVKTPFLGTYHVGADSSLSQHHMIQDNNLLFEGVRWRNNHLYAAVHTGGLLVYQTDETGKPALVNKLGGFANAWKLEFIGQQGYVADAEGGVKVIDVSVISKPKMLQGLKSTGMVRDLDGHEKRVYAALGGHGIDVFKRAADGKLTFEFNVPPNGSAQAVSYDNGLLAVANWSHSAIYDAGSMNILATEKIKNYPHFEQDFGVFLRDGIMYVGEWEGLHMVKFKPGFVAPDMWIEQELLTFAPGKGTQAQVVVVRNRGLADLKITKIDLPNKLFVASPQTLTVPPGGAKTITVTFTGKDPNYAFKQPMKLWSNDPDSYQNPFQLFLVVQTGQGSWDVGDTLDSTFGWLDPTGAGQVSALKGKVTVLAYFALF